MNALHSTDQLQVTARSCGTILLTLNMSGVSDLSDVFRQVRESASQETGIVNVTLRNRTRGWTCRHNLVFRRSKPTPITRQCKSSDQYPSLFA